MCLGPIMLAHCGRVTHIYILIKLIIMGSDHDLSPGRRQAIILDSVGYWLM